MKPWIINLFFGLLLLTACTPMKTPVGVWPHEVCWSEGGTLVEVKGYLWHGDSIQRTTEILGSRYYQLTLTDLPFQTADTTNSVTFTIYEGEGKNRMKALSQVIQFAESDFEVFTGNGAPAKLGDHVELTGKLSKSSNFCSISLDQITLLPH